LSYRRMTWRRISWIFSLPQARRRPERAIRPPR